MNGVITQLPTIQWNLLTAKALNSNLEYKGKNSLLGLSLFKKIIAPLLAGTQTSRFVKI